MTAILGLNAFHPDSSACLVVDGKLVAAIAEERLGQRNKHTMAFPINAIKTVLSHGGVSLSDVTHLAIARSTSSNLLAKARYTLGTPSIGINAAIEFFKRQTNTKDILENLSEQLGVDASQVQYDTFFVEHHLAHIASSYFVSDLDKSAALSYDGSGDFASAMSAVCEGTKIDVIGKVCLPDSLGHFYSSMCQFIGFDLFGEEYKVMGLAPYGEDLFETEMNKILKIDSLKWFKLNKKMFQTHKGLSESSLEDGKEMRLGKLYTPKLIELLGQPRERNAPITQREKNIAKSTQRHFERAATNCLKHLETKASLKDLVLSGGCSLNGVMNAKIYRNFDVENMYIQAAASDDGTAIGAAFACWHMHLKQTERFHMKHAFWGNEYSPQQIRKAIKLANYSINEFKTQSQTVEIAANYIAAGSVVGWFQGRSEWGPRALGNRSILANPTIPSMKEIINKKIKKRESFRPFAPSVLREDVAKLFEQNIDSPFMMHVVKFKEEFRNTFPAVTHVDGTGRLQTVDKENNALYYQLINAVKKRTGFGIILNTSFNENEPVVETPEQAIACFDRTGMDVLVMGNFIITKNGQNVA